MRSILLLCIFVVVCSAGCGTFTAPSGNVYNLDPLTTAKDYTAIEPGTIVRNYWYNYCQHINLSVVPCYNPTYVAQVTPSTNTCISLGYSYPTISELASKNGVQIVTQNMVDLCGNPKTIPRVSTFYLSCNPFVEYNLTRMQETATCQYEFAAQSRYACPNAAPPPSNKSDCCTPSGVSGCLEPAIESCVCKREPSCCTGNWTKTCVDLVSTYGCGDCKLGKCCEPHGGKGCEDRTVSTCVCNKRESCCTQSWDKNCVNTLITDKCGYCAGVCCTEGSCHDQDVRDCVCRRDVYCCNVRWDSTCVNEAAEYNCTVCAASSLSPKSMLSRLMH